MSDIEKALEVFKGYVGYNNLSNAFIDFLSEYNLSETDGYLIKLKVNDEILTGSVDESSVIDRVNYMVSNLSKRRTVNDNPVNYDYYIINYLYNVDYNKTICEYCGKTLLFINEYCYNCGSKQVYKISLSDLLSTIKSTHIKPGDIIRVNDDYSIDKTSSDSLSDNKLLDSQVDYLQSNSLKEKNIISQYLLVLMMDYINKNKVLNNFTNIYSRFSILDVQSALSFLLDINLIYQSFNNLFVNSVNKVKDFSNFDEFNRQYSLTDKGSYYLHKYDYVLFYFEIIENSVIDDLIEFDKLCQRTDSLMEVSCMLIDKCRRKYRDKGLFEEYLLTFNIESYIYGFYGDVFNKIKILHKRLLLELNYNLSHNLMPLNENYVNYIKDEFNLNHIDTDTLNSIVGSLYQSSNIDYIISCDDFLDILKKVYDSWDIDKLNEFILNRYGFL